MKSTRFLLCLTSLIIFLGTILGACQAAPTPEPIVETLVVTEIVQGNPVQVIRIVTPTPEPAGPRTLVICQGLELGTLYDYISDHFTTVQILGAIIDGPIDNNSYGYQPVILEKLPDLADGDATLTPVNVSEGDRVVDARGEIVTLRSGADEPIMLKPAGGGDAVAYQGGEFEMDQLSASFTLLPNLQWSDGTPLTASDSVYAFSLLTDPDTEQEKYTEDRTASYEAIDDLTTVWTGLPGFIDATYYINFFGPKPEHIWGQFTADDLTFVEESNRFHPGWGPYVVGEWIPGESITLHKNSNYWRADQGLPRFDTVIFRFLGHNANANIAALLSGECDMLDQTNQLDGQSELLLELQISGQIKANFVTGTVWEHIDFGIQPQAYDDGYQPGVDRADFFSDVRTRRAFMMCMDRQAVVDTVLFGQSSVLDNYIPAEHPLFNANIQTYQFNVEAGSALLEEVGWLDDDHDPATPRIAQGVTNVPDGTLLQVSYETSDNPLRQQVTAIIQESFAQCGIKADIHLYTSSLLFEGSSTGPIFGRNFDLGQFAWLTGVEPPCDLFLSSLTPGEEGQSWISIMDGSERTFGTSEWWGQNITGFANSQFDQACNQALASMKGQPEYTAAHHEAQRIFAEQLPTAPLFPRLQIVAMRPDMCNVITDPTAESDFLNIENFDYGEGCVE